MSVTVSTAGTLLGGLKRSHRNLKRWSGTGHLASDGSIVQNGKFWWQGGGGWVREGWAGGVDERPVPVGEPQHSAYAKQSRRIRDSSERTAARGAPWPPSLLESVADATHTRSADGRVLKLHSAQLESPRRARLAQS